jgi:transposase InsO family protein
MTSRYKSKSNQILNKSVFESIIKSVNKLSLTNDIYNSVFSYLKKGILPPDLNDNQLYKFKRRWGDDFQLDTNNNNIVHRKLRSVLVQPGQQKTVLERLYKNNIALGVGLDEFYNKVRSQYIGITRDTVRSFLREKSDYQLTSGAKKFIVVPVVSKTINHIWSIDLIDFGEEFAHKRYRYVLNCIDIFSRKIWARPIKNKTVANVKTALQSIFVESGNTPVTIRSDNGKEFLIKDWLKENFNINQVFGLTYSPESNAHIERSNKDLRKVLRALSLKNEKPFYDNLKEAIDIRNNTNNSSTGYTPNQLYNPKNTNIIEEVQQKNENRLKSLDELVQNNIISVGDTVRLYLPTMFKEMRKLIKSGNSKQIVVKWSPQIFRVHSAIKTKNHITYYTISNIHNEMVYNPDKENVVKKFYHSQLLKVREDSIANIDQTQANRLNNI